MGLEIGDYIDDLNPANPVFNDPVREGDDHLRLIKKCLVQSFPGVDDAVNLTAAQLNDVALKGEANTFTEAGNKFLEFLVFAALKGIQIEDSLGTARNAVSKDANDDNNFGNDAENSVLLAAIAAFVNIAGADVAQFVERANGSLELADDAGTFGRAMAVHLVNTITGSTRLANTVALKGLKADGTTEVDLASVSGVDERIFGGTTDVTKVAGSRVELRAGIDEGGRVVIPAEGGLKVSEHVGTLRKVAYRDPSEDAVSTGPYNAKQSDEGRVKRITGGNVDVNLPTLDQYTTFTVITGGVSGTTITNGSGVTTIEWISGGVLETGTSYDISPGSIVQVRYRTASIVEIWGNGIAKS